MKFLYIIIPSFTAYILHLAYVEIKTIQQVSERLNEFKNIKITTKEERLAKHLLKKIHQNKEFSQINKLTTK
ncbi:MAG: hypothetical protein MK132_19880 [Lentisphaerales bacterium]|nr:hypothetical protein [Lentisphaerales bacterium]